MKEELQKRRVIYMGDTQWEKLGKKAKKEKTTRSAIIRDKVKN